VSTKIGFVGDLADTALLYLGALHGINRKPGVCRPIGDDAACIVAATGVPNSGRSRTATRTPAKSARTRATAEACNAAHTSHAAGSASREPSQTRICPGYPALAAASTTSAAARTAAASGKATPGAADNRSPTPAISPSRSRGDSGYPAQAAASTARAHSAPSASLCVRRRTVCHDDTSTTTPTTPDGNVSHARVEAADPAALSTPGRDHASREAAGRHPR